MDIEVENCHIELQIDAEVVRFYLESQMGGKGESNARKTLFT